MRNKYLQLSSALVFCAMFILGACSEKKSTVSSNKTYTYDNLDGVYAAAAKQNQGAQGADSYPAVMVETENGATVPMKMTALRVDVQVIGNIATTTMYMQFYNTMDQVIEGHMYFPLLEGQTISRFAMDVNGKMRDGVTVEKERGRRGFESVTRRQIDPGLIEWTKGNNFKARIYPIPSRGTKQIIVAYDQELAPVAAGYQYRLPLNFEGEIPKFRAQARVYQQDLAPIMDGNELEKFKFQKDNKDFAGGVIFKDYEANKPFVFTIPKKENFRDVLISKVDENSAYFIANVKPTIQPRPRKIPNKIGLVWDVSNSSTGRNELKELKILKDYFARIKSTEVELIAFSNEIQETKKFKIVNGDSKELINYLIDITHDGGTQLGSVNLASYKNDLFILSSDGISNIGEKNIGLGRSPVLVLNSNVVADHSYLKNVAYKSGGEYINSTYLSSDESVDLMLNESVKFISSVNENGLVKETYPSGLTQVNGSMTLAGQLVWSQSDLDINFGYGNEISETITVSLDDESSVNSELMKKIWAQKKLAELDMNYIQNKDEITTLGKQHSIVTRNTSLIVLDRIEDYKAFGITPPKEVQAEIEYFNEDEFFPEEDNPETYSHKEQVVASFENKLDLWKKDFDKDAVAYNNAENSTDNVQSGRNGATSMSLFNFGTKFKAAASGNGGASALERDYDNLSYSEEAPVIPSSGTIELKPGDSKRSYMRLIKSAKDEDLYNTYLEVKKEFGSIPSYYVDVAALMSKRGQAKEAIRVLSNLAELELENSELLRVLGKELEELREIELAISIYSDILEIRGEEPQSYRDLALLKAKNGDYQEAADLLATVITGDWDARFTGIESIAISDINAINKKAGGNLNLNIDSRLQQNMDCDIRVVLTWDADNTDVDLWVTDSRGERCHAGHMKTAVGGVLSNNYVGGYGPEEFWAKDAVSGKYKIQAKFNGKLPQRIAGPVSVNAKIYTDFGRDNEQMKEVTVRIEKRNEVISLGEIDITN